MRIAAPIRAAASAALLVVACALAPGNALAQTGAAPATPGAAATEPAKPARTRKKSDAAARKEPTAGQMAARERQRKCAAEWKEAKAAGKTGSTKWPQYWSQCNTRLKEQRA